MFWVMFVLILLLALCAPELVLAVLLAWALASLITSGGVL